MTDLTLILGPMKSGKSFDLISHFAPLAYTDIAYALFQNARHTRDATVWSRNGISMEAERVQSLSDILPGIYDVIGIDEAHMFPPDDTDIVKNALLQGCTVVVSGLDMDYRGRMFNIVQRLMELGPSDVRYRRAVCEVCRKPNAIHTQVYHNGYPVVEGLPSVLPEDGTYVYRPVCRQCFVQWSPSLPVLKNTDGPVCADLPQPLQFA